MTNRDANKNWRKTIFAWLHQQDHSLVTNTSMSMQKFTTSSCEELASEIAKTNRIIESNQKRQIKSLKRESNILGVEERLLDQDTACVSLLVSRKHMYESGNKLIEEQTEDLLSLRLERCQEDEWKIASFFQEETFLPRDNRIMVSNSDSLFTLVQNSKYNPEEAVRYAHMFWNTPNRDYVFFASDNCTNFISQVLNAGGFPMEMTDSPSSGWWYKRGQNRQNDKWSSSWVMADGLVKYLTDPKRRSGPKVTQMQFADQLQLGDIISYDWKGTGRWNHNAVVVGFDDEGVPLVNANSNNSSYRYWPYVDSEAWTPQTKYMFLHIDR